MSKVISAVLCLVITIMSCRTENDKSVEKEDISMFAHGVIATVTTEFQDEGCEVLLKLNGESELLMPVELEDKYKEHGLELLITYSNSRIMQSKCQMGRPILLKKIKLVE